MVLSTVVKLSMVLKGKNSSHQMHLKLAGRQSCAPHLQPNVGFLMSHSRQAEASVTTTPDNGTDRLLSL